ncbi:MAG: HAD family hydrolase [Candidatus Kryptoniota bacterium]
MNNNFEAIVFDLGNVLMPFDYRSIVNQLNDIYPLLGNRFLDFYRDNYEIHRSFEKGHLTIEEFTGMVLKALDNKLDSETFWKIYSQIFTVNTTLVDLLPKFKAHYKLVLLSNTNEIHRKYGWGDLKFLKYFDRLVLSYEIGAVKPEPEIYEAVEQFTCAPPHKHLYFDDIPEYVDAARKRGWDGVQFVTNELLEKALEDRGILL